jgi:hypothetical protein
MTESQLRLYAARHGIVIRREERSPVAKFKEAIRKHMERKGWRRPDPPPGGQSSGEVSAPKMKGKGKGNKPAGGMKGDASDNKQNSNGDNDDVEEKAGTRAPAAGPENEKFKALGSDEAMKEYLMSLRQAKLRDMCKDRKLPNSQGNSKNLLADRIIDDENKKTGVDGKERPLKKGVKELVTSTKTTVRGPTKTAPPRDGSHSTSELDGETNSQTDTKTDSPKASNKPPVGTDGPGQTIHDEDPELEDADIEHELTLLSFSRNRAENKDRALRVQNLDNGWGEDVRAGWWGDEGLGLHSFRSLPRDSTGLDEHVQNMLQGDAARCRMAATISITAMQAIRRTMRRKIAEAKEKGEKKASVRWGFYCDQGQRRSVALVEWMVRRKEGDFPKWRVLVDHVELRHQRDTAEDKDGKEPKRAYDLKLSPYGISLKRWPHKEEPPDDGSWMGVLPGGDEFFNIPQNLVTTITEEDVTTPKPGKFRWPNLPGPETSNVLVLDHSSDVDAAHDGLLTGMLRNARIVSGDAWHRRTRLTSSTGRMFFHSRRPLRRYYPEDQEETLNTSWMTNRVRSKVWYMYQPVRLDFGYPDEDTGHNRSLADLFYVELEDQDIPSFFFFRRPGEWEDPTIPNLESKLYPIEAKMRRDDLNRKLKQADEFNKLDRSAAQTIPFSRTQGREKSKKILSLPVVVSEDLKSELRIVTKALWEDGLKGALERARSYGPGNAEFLLRNFPAGLPSRLTVPPVHNQKNGRPKSVAWKVASLNPRMEPSASHGRAVSPLRGDEPWTLRDDRYWPRVPRTDQNSYYCLDDSDVEDTTEQEALDDESDPPSSDVESALLEYFNGEVGVEESTDEEDNQADLELEDDEENDDNNQNTGEATSSPPPAGIKRARSVSSQQITFAKKRKTSMGDALGANDGADGNDYDPFIPSVSSSNRRWSSQAPDRPSTRRGSAYPRRSSPNANVLQRSFEDDGSGIEEERLHVYPRMTSLFQFLDKYKTQGK